MAPCGTGTCSWIVKSIFYCTLPRNATRLERQRGGRFLPPAVGCLVVAVALRFRRRESLNLRKRTQEWIA